MNSEKSKSWRSLGDAAAFSDFAWESKARQFYIVGKRLVGEIEPQLKNPSFEAIMGFATGEYLLCLALELMIKAYYLKAKVGPCEYIYQHEVSELLPNSFLSEPQIKLLKHAERYVVWAGRYPTPKWTKEHFKADFDVDTTMVDGKVVIDGNSIPNSASLPRSKELAELFEYVWQAWKRLPDS